MPLSFSSDRGWIVSKAFRIRRQNGRSSRGDEGNHGKGFIQKARPVRNSKACCCCKGKNRRYQVLEP